MAYGSALGVSLPVVSTTPGPTYATTINTFLTALQAIVEQKVRPADMDINADLSFLSGATYFRAKNLLATSYNNAGLLSAVTYPTSLYFSSGEAYVNDAAGNQVKLTNGGAVNISSAGGITGAGYGAAGVEVNWAAGDLAYALYSSAGVYADAFVNDVKLFDNSTNSITLTAASIAADYTLTLPSAVPATNNTVLAMATTGALTATATPTVTTLTTTGLLTSGAGVSVTGTVAASGAVSGSAVSTTGSITAGTVLRHNGNVTRYVSAFAGVLETGSGAATTASGQGSVSLTSNSIWMVPIILSGTETLNSLSWFVDPGGTATKTFKLFSVNGFDGVVTEQESTTSASSSTNEYTLTVSPTLTPGSGLRIMYAYFQAGDTDELFGISYTFTN